MAKNKLAKFADMKTMDHVLEVPFGTLQREGFSLRGNWAERMFGNNNPITVELGCGKGEYTVGLARRYPDRNFIGIDIKGARMWTGASQARAEGLGNVAFLRTNIELLPHFFAPGEVAEIWITFPDPQMKKQRKRLTSARFVDMYRQVLGTGGRINLKTDSPFLYAYTSRLCAANPDKVTVVHDTDNLYERPTEGTPLDIRTYYEQQWLSRGLTIKYLAFDLCGDGPLTEVDDSDLERDTYRSFSRGHI